jgi:hypothetical protein
VVSEAILRALAKDPMERFASADAFDAALQGQPAGPSKTTGSVS